MRMSAKAEYAVRAMVELASVDEGVLVKTDELAQAQGIPPQFLVDILSVLRTDRLVRSHRGREGGYELASPAGQISIADVLRSIDGPLASVHDMGHLLMKLADRELKESDVERDANMELENRIAMGRRFSTSFNTESLGPPSGYVCPDCNGSLQMVSEGNFRCRVGHAWSGDALLQARDEEVETALWVALRSLQEKSRLARRLAEDESSTPLYERYNALADEAEHAVTVLGDRLAEAYTEAGDHGAG